MKISNFKLDEIVTKGDNYNRYIFATVDITTGILWWKKTKTRKVCKTSTYTWHFVDTGKFTPGLDVETLVRAYNAQHLTNL